MAGLLLAGGAFNTVSAEQFDAAKDYGSQYYHVRVDSRQLLDENSQWLDVDGTETDANIRFSLEKNKSTLWTVKKSNKHC